MAAAVLAHRASGLSSGGLVLYFRRGPCIASTHHGPIRAGPAIHVDGRSGPLNLHEGEFGPYLRLSSGS